MQCRIKTADTVITSNSWMFFSPQTLILWQNFEHVGFRWTIMHADSSEYFNNQVKNYLYFQFFKSVTLLIPWRLWGFWSADQTKSDIWSCIGCFWTFNKLTIKWKYLANSLIKKRTIGCSPIGGMLLTATNITFCSYCKTFKGLGNNRIFLHFFF